MKVIMIVGQYIGISPYQSRIFARSAENAAIYVLLFGGVPIVPHKNTRGLEGVNVPELGVIDYFTITNAYLELVERVDALWVLPSWKADDVAVELVKRAEELRVRRLITKEEVLRFIQSGEMSVKSAEKFGNPSVTVTQSEGENEEEVED